MIALKQIKSLSHNLLKLVVIAALVALATASLPQNLTRINTSVASVLDVGNTAA